MLKFVLTIFAFLGFFWALDAGTNPNFRNKMINYLLNLENISNKDRIVELHQTFLHKFERYYYVENSEINKFVWTGIITSISIYFVMVIISNFFGDYYTFEGFLIYSSFFGYIGASIVYIIKIREDLTYILSLSTFTVVYIYFDLANIVSTFAYLVLIFYFFLWCSTFWWFILRLLQDWKNPHNFDYGMKYYINKLKNGIILLILFYLGYLIVQSILHYINFDKSTAIIFIILQFIGIVFSFYYYKNYLLSPIRVLLISSLSVVMITIILNWFLPQIIESFLFDLKNIGRPIVAYLFLNIFADTLSLLETKIILREADVSTSPTK